MIINDSVTRADIRLSRCLSATLIYWKKYKILTVYRILYEDHELQQITKKGRKRKLKDLDQFVESNLVSIEIPTTPYVSNMSYDPCICMVLLVEHFGEYMLRNASLPIDIPLTKEPWKQEDRKDFLGVKYPKQKQKALALPIAQQATSKKVTCLQGFFRRQS